ncbi:MAG: DUF3846 domain-containing protein [Collinsella sp.]
MNEMQAHGLLIPVGSKPFEVWIDKNNSLAELQDLVNGNVDVLSVLGNGVDLWVNEEGLINGSKPNRAIYATKHMEEVGYLDQLTFGHPVKEGELYSLICGDFVAFGVDEEGEIASLPQETIDKLKETLRTRPPVTKSIFTLSTASNRIDISFRMSTPPATSMRNLRSLSPKSLQKPGRVH